MSYTISTDHPETEERRASSPVAWVAWAAVHAPWTPVTVFGMAQVYGAASEDLRARVTNGGTLTAAETTTLLKQAHGVMGQQTKDVIRFAVSKGYGITIDHMPNMLGTDAASSWTKAHA